MKKEPQHRGWISGTRQRAVNGAVALAALIVPMVVVTQSVQAQSFSVLYSFNAADGVDSKSGLVRDKAGNLYGTTQIGGIGDGEVFKLDTTGTETVLYSFTGPDGIEPSAGLIRDKEGNLYGTTLTGNVPSVGTVFKLDTTNTLTALHSFTGPDGNFPLADLVRDKEGNLYGTTYFGGTSGEGTVFKLDTTGTETVLHSFTGPPDGANPLAGLVRDKEGNLYGTTKGGGVVRCFGSGCGVVFKLDTTGKETVLYTFTGLDGFLPAADLVRDKAGNLYGTTFGGGATNQGTVFKLDTTGTQTVLHSFTRSDGAGPLAGLVMDKAGNLYGTTYAGGDLSCNAPSGCGVVFKLDPVGAETVLHTFSGGADGANPQEGGLVRDRAGNLYGTTSNGGASGFGTIFKLTPDASQPVR